MKPAVLPKRPAAPHVAGSSLVRVVQWRPVIRGLGTVWKKDGVDVNIRSKVSVSPCAGWRIRSLRAIEKPLAAMRTATRAETW